MATLSSFAHASSAAGLLGQRSVMNWAMPVIRSFSSFRSPPDGSSPSSLAYARQGKLGRVLRIGTVGIVPGEELADHRRLVVIARGPIQIGQVIADDVPLLDRRVRRRVRQGETEVLQGLGPQGRFLLRFHVGLVELVPGDLGTVAGLLVVLGRLGLPAAVRPAGDRPVSPAPAADTRRESGW